MNAARLNQLKKNFDGLGTKQNVLYTNQEVIERLTGLQGAMARGVFEKTHAENLRDRDIMIHFEALAKEYKLNETETFLRFKNNMNEFGYTIGSFIKGMNGERIARRALKLLSYDKEVRILYNIQLEDDDVQAEYDAIIVAPYGLFVVEVKNWGSSVTLSSNGIIARNDDSGVIYDLPGRMSVKEALLREYLEDIFPASYHNMLLFSNERIQIEDNYHQIFISCGGGISYEIKSYAKKGNSMTMEQVNKIADAILANHKEQRALCTVKCDEIIEDYAKLMVQIESASSGDTNRHDEVANHEVEAEGGENNSKTSLWYNRIDWTRVVAGVAMLVIPGVIAVAVKHKH